MAHDIFKLFKKSIEQVEVKNTPRGTLTPGVPTFDVSIDAIVKRRKLMAETANEGEDYNNNTTVHFRTTDAQYIAVGNYVKIDNEWHSILQVKPGKHFRNGKVLFIYVTLNNDIVDFGDEPVWGED